MRDDTYFRLRGWIPIPLYGLVAVGLDPSAPEPWQLGLGGALALAGLLLRAWARVHIGRSSDTRRLHARRLVTTGPYAYVRNPLYVGNLGIAVGLAIWIGSTAGVALLALALALHYARVVRAEEHGLEGDFGDRYRAYRDATPRWLPSARLWQGARSVGDLRRELRIAALVVATAVLGLAIRLGFPPLQ
jgi:protein-S-isoprenylcysteine O-methyltransferase Ste14